MNVVVIIFTVWQFPDGGWCDLFEVLCFLKLCQNTVNLKQFQRVSAFQEEET